MPHSLTLREIKPVTHDTHHYVFGTPPGFDFTPGQAAELAIDKDGWRDEGRPFTFASLPGEQTLDFIVKSYPAHDGVTKEMPQQEPGTVFTMDGPFGAIEDKGPGVFLAAGAGITPFIPILRKRALDGALEGCHLIFANKTKADIILHDTWGGMDLRTDYVLSEENADGMRHGQLDQAMLGDLIADFDQHFYICGPQGFVNDIRDGLTALGAKKGHIVTEEGW